MEQYDLDTVYAQIFGPIFRIESSLPARVLVGDHILARLHPLKNMVKDLMIRLKWPINSMV